MMGSSWITSWWDHMQKLEERGMSTGREWDRYGYDQKLINILAQGKGRGASVSNRHWENDKGRSLKKVWGYY